jgi:hypothetical protein
LTIIAVTLPETSLSNRVVTAVNGTFFTLVNVSTVDSTVFTKGLQSRGSKFSSTVPGILNLELRGDEYGRGSITMSMENLKT